MSNRVGPQIGNGNTELRGPSNSSYAHVYISDHHQKRPQQTHRSSTISSNSETPLKYKTTRKPNLVSNVERTHMQQLETSPLFLDRLLDGEVQDFREFTRIIEKQNREIVELKNTNIEMEGRLEHQTRERIELECIIEDQEKLWNEKCQQLSIERDEFFKSLQTEKTTNKKLWDLVYAKEKEIQRAYQRRYDGPPQYGNRRGGPGHQRPPPEKGSTQSRSGSSDRSQAIHKSPHDLLEATGSHQSAQERNAVKLLEGFFGF
mmetsp:Transcript_8842/g.16683  ORF Transcript_8842/g.16683 Transcript_8842/m.16683 type:complete len:261 (+) Transcript_8842:194-976(+)